MKRRYSPLFALAVTCLVFQTTGALSQEKPVAKAPDKIVRIDPPESGFYAKELVYEGIPIKAPEVVADEALFKAREWMNRELQHLPDAAYNLKIAGAEFHIIGRDQQTSDLPEYRHMKGKPFDGKLTVDERTRGLGGLSASCGEENLLKLPKDRYHDRDICPHEFAHTLMNYGLTRTIRTQIHDQRAKSLAAGKWVKAYAGSNDDEYFAELTMWYFGGHGDMGMTGEKPAPGPEGLKKYDPEAYAFFDSVYSGHIKVDRVAVEALTAQTAASEKTLRSGNSSVPTTIRFSNQTDQVLSLFWLDSDGKRHPYGTVPPHGRAAQNTFATHVWLVADAQGMAIALFTAVEKQGLATIPYLKDRGN